MRNMQGTTTTRDLHESNLTYGKLIEEENKFLWSLIQGADDWPSSHDSMEHTMSLIVARGWSLLFRSSTNNKCPGNLNVQLTAKHKNNGQRVDSSIMVDMLGNKPGQTLCYLIRNHLKAVLKRIEEIDEEEK